MAAPARRRVIGRPAAAPRRRVRTVRRNDGRHDAHEWPCGPAHAQHASKDGGAADEVRHQTAQRTPVAWRQRDRGGGSRQRLGFMFALRESGVMRQRFGVGLVLA